MDIRKFFGGGIVPKKKEKKTTSAQSSSSVRVVAVPSTPTTTTTTTTTPPSAANNNRNGNSHHGDSGKSTRSSSPPTARRELSPRNEKRTREEKVVTTKTKIENSDIQAADNYYDEDEEMEEDYLEQARKRRAAARDVGKGGQGDGGGSVNSSSKIKSGGAGGRRRRVIEEEEEEEDDDDFQPNANNDHDDDDDDESIGMQPPTKKTSPTKKRHWSASPPKRTSPRKITASSSTSNKECAERPTSSWSMPKISSPPPPHPPKYHPPSSKLSTHIPFLRTETLNEDGFNKNSNDNKNTSIDSRNKIILPHVTSHDLPRLPKTDNFLSTFTDDTIITPHCLDGLTFVFTGILSTNDAYTSQTNAQVALSSPSKGDYYTNRRYDCSASSYELARDTAVDIIKCLGGRVTTMVSGKTDYVICGNILEDGRVVTEGSKYKKCVELWEAWSAKWRKEYQNSSNDDNVDTESKSPSSTKKKSTTKGAKPKKDHDPNTLVEVIHGINEFYGLVMYLSKWKKSTLSETERMELDSRQMQKFGSTSSSSSAAATLSVATGEIVKKEEEANNDGNPSFSSSTVAAVASNPHQPSAAPSNPYVKKAPVPNPYVKASTTAVANPYTNSSSTNSAVSNPYTKKSVSSNSCTNSTTTTITAASSSARTLQNQRPSLHPGSGKELGANSLWVDKYAPSNTSEILGNSDSVNKLSRWLSSWEKTFNNPKKQQKGGNGGPNGPWRAALLSGPPGIGKTTTATLVARESGRDVLELNASDSRSKKALGEALGDVTGSQVLSFANMRSGKKASDAPAAALRRKRCIIMDEVDGLGAGDRNGMSELIQMIKKSKVPIICICNDRSSPKMKSLLQYCMDLKYSRPTKLVIAKRAVEIGRREGMNVEINAAEAMAESCGNDIRQVLNSLQMWSCNSETNKSNNDLTYRELKERQYEINKDEVLRVSMFDACRTIVEGSRGLAGADAKTVTSSLMKRTDAYFVDYMLMGLMVHQNYLKVCMGQYNNVKLKGDVDLELESLNQMYDAAEAMSDFGMVEDNLRGGDQNWSLLPLCSLLAVKVGHHAGGPTGGFLPGFPEFAGWLGKNSTRNKKIRLLQEFCRHMNYKVSADAPELRMNYLPIMRQQFEELLVHKDGPKVTEAIELMDEYGLDREDVFENFDEFLFNTKELKVKKFGDLDSKAKAAFTRAYNAMAHKAQALVSEQGAEKTGRKKVAGGDNGGETGGAELDVVDDDKANNEKSDEDDDDDAEDLVTLKKKFSKKGGGNVKAVGKATAPSKSNGKKGKK